MKQMIEIHKNELLGRTSRYTYYGSPSFIRIHDKEENKKYSQATVIAKIFGYEDINEMLFDDAFLDIINTYQEVYGEFPLITVPNPFNNEYYFVDEFIKNLSDLFITQLKAIYERFHLAG